MKKYFALLCSLTWCMTEWTVARAELVTSAVMTVRFGIEQDWPDSVQLDSRHGDLAAYYCGGAGRLRWDMDAPPATALYDMDEAHAYANSLTRETMSAALLPAYAFIGATNGQTFWNLNQNQMAGELYLGINGYGDASALAPWNPQDPDRGASGNARFIRIDLVSVRGPSSGYVSVFQFGAPNPSLYLSSYEDGIGPEDRMYTTVGAHDHYNFTFTQPGLYEVDLRLVTAVNWTNPVNFEVTRIERDSGGGADLLRWPTDPCTRYTATWSPHPHGPWTEIPDATGISGPGPELVVTNPIPAPATVFYRVLATP
ncbi:MAG: hypothetical protein H7A43_08380 [Verrucomicrobia bacterium]|nr:choice-of-anchor M domain-containing protein [Kiritimatiellia bacterium]MCB1101741.1 choice-of-anchor M domain-containing protein [Kiritimatiellia bacterium]MCP5488652.1 hypothetical protein [Verrucomicrobiota bacterium]